MAIDTPDTVCTIAGVQVQLEVPPSYAERWEVYNSLQGASARDLPEEVMVRLLSAAVGLCCPRLRRYLSRQKVEYSGDLRRYGAAVADFHATLPGATPRLMAELVAAGRLACRMCEDSLLTQAQMQAAQDFTAAPVATSSSNSSRSSSLGAGTQGGSDPYSQSKPQG